MSKQFHALPKHTTKAKPNRSPKATPTDDVGDSPYSNILQLQRTIGNQATIQLLRNNQANPITTGGINRALIQRSELTDDASDKSEDADGDGMQLVPTDPEKTGEAAFDEKEYFEKVEAAVKETFEEYSKVMVTVPLQYGTEDGAYDVLGFSNFVPITLRLVYFSNAGWFKNKSDKGDASTYGEKHFGALDAVWKKLKVSGSAAKYGKGSPEALQEYMQSIIHSIYYKKADNKKIDSSLPQPGETAEEWQSNLQGWIEDNHIGIDCSGFVYRALEKVEAETGYAFMPKDEWGTSPGEEALTIWNDSAVKVTTPADLKPGDMMYNVEDNSHIRIVMSVQENDGWIEVDTAESSRSKNGPNIRKIRYKADAADFDQAVETMQEKFGTNDWHEAEAERKEYRYFRMGPKEALPSNDDAS